MTVSFKLKEEIDKFKLVGKCHDALMTDGGHHKQWYLEEILKEIVTNFDELKNRYDWEDGIPP